MLNQNNGLRHSNFAHQLPIHLVLRRELQRTGEDLLRQFDPLRIGGPHSPCAVIEEQPRAEEAVFGETEGEFVLPIGIRRIQGRQVLRLGQQAGAESAR